MKLINFAQVGNNNWTRPIRYYVFLKLIKIFILLILPINAWTQALPVAKPENVNRAISGAMTSAMTNRGFASNDPRFGNTIARMTPALQSVAGGAAVITLGTVTAPGWITGALAVGLGTAISYAVGIAVDALVNWFFRDDGKIDQSGLEGERDSSNGIALDTPAWRATLWTTKTSTQYMWGGDGLAVAREAEASYRKVNGFPPNIPTCSVATNGQTVSCGNSIATLFLSGTPGGCPSGTFWVAGNCSQYGFLIPTSVPAVSGQTPQQAVNALPAKELDKQLNPKIIAGIADRAWQTASSQPGYDGLPYSVNKPITEADVQTWINENPHLAPTVRDFVSPNPVTPSNPTPWAVPLNPTSPNIRPEIPNSNSTNPAAQNPQINLGADPGIGAPTLEATPTAQQIMEPILNLVPELRSFQARTESGTCPRPSFELFNKVHVLDAHCKLIDDNKSIMQAAMSFAWAVFALFIILSA